MTGLTMFLIIAVLIAALVALYFVTLVASSLIIYLIKNMIPTTYEVSESYQRHPALIRTSDTITDGLLSHIRGESIIFHVQEQE